MLENFNMNFNLRVFINPSEESWVESPAKDVVRIPFEREAAESGHTTSLVRYLPGTSFRKHSHPLGEEIFVLEGIFSDEEGNYPAGTYIRNAPGTSHAPFSKEGCLLLVKLNQFNPMDGLKVRIDTKNGDWRQGHGNLKVFPLHTYGTENTALVKWPAHEVFLPHTHFGGEEIFVIQGTFMDDHGNYPIHSWLRSPHMSQHHPRVEDETIIFVKTGHLIKE